MDYAKPLLNELRANLVRAEGDFTADPIKAKIASAEQARVHTMLVIGARDVDAGNVSVRLHGKGPQGARPRGGWWRAFLRPSRRVNLDRLRDIHTSFTDDEARHHGVPRGPTTIMAQSFRDWIDFIPLMESILRKVSGCNFMH